MIMPKMGPKSLKCKLARLCSHVPKTCDDSLGVTRMDTIRNEYMRGTAPMGRFGENTRGKTEVVWTCI